MVFCWVLFWFSSFKLMTQLWDNCMLLHKQKSLDIITLRVQLAKLWSLILASRELSCQMECPMRKNMKIRIKRSFYYHELSIPIIDSHLKVDLVKQVN